MKCSKAEQFGREMELSVVDTLRVSVTDRCNLRCIYCTPKEGVTSKSHEEILRFEEMERIVRAAVRGGAHRVRLTGGEPLVRRNVARLVELLAGIEGLSDLSMTTNGVLLAEYASILKSAGLKRITISVDSLKPERYLNITGSSELGNVLRGIEAAHDVGLWPVKLNVVVMRGLNEDEPADFARFAAENDIEVRFIELMPVAASEWVLRCKRAGDAMVPSAEARKRIEKELGTLIPLENSSYRPAQIFKLPGGRGRVGFISPVTEPFCANCTRMRLTADGKLRGCLFSAFEMDVRDALRRGAGDDELLAIFNEAVRQKPKRTAPAFSDNQRWMIEIGG